jgi:hypothetical protein
VNRTLWRWYPAKDEWEVVTQATPEMERKVAARYRKHDVRGARYKWTEGYKPKKFRTKTKKG